MEEDRKKHIIKLDTRVSLGPEHSNLHLDKKRAAIKAALHSAVAGLAATTSGLAQTVNVEGMHSDTPWGEVIIGPVWEERVRDESVLTQAAELKFWE